MKKNKILKLTTKTASVALILGMAMCDSKNILIPFMIMIPSIAWIGIFFKVNHDYYERRYR